MLPTETIPIYPLPYKLALTRERESRICYNIQNNTHKENLMKSTLRLLLISALLLLSACSLKPVTLQTQSHQEVRYQAPLQAKNYHWQQLSGVSVTLPEPDSQTLHFIAPVVTQEAVLVFALEAKNGDSVQRLQVKVIVSPAAEETTTTGGSDDNSSTGGSDTSTATGGDSNATAGGGSDGNTSAEDNSSTGGGSDTNTSTGGGSNATAGGDSGDSNATGGSDDSNMTDVTPPILTLNGEANITLEQNTAYTELGAMALDTVDGNVSVSISGTVDTATVGHYVVTYTATDSAGNESSVTRSIEVANTTPMLTSLSLESNATTVNKAGTVRLSVMGTYSDKSTKPLTSGITWIITPSDAVTIRGNTLTTLKDGNVTVQAKVGTTLSNTVTLNIYWEVNGHRLPPEPDKALNDTTLLGIDTNNNGIRDDVERWIYETYKHPIERAVFIQLAKALQYRVGNEDRDKNERIKDEIKAGECYVYWSLVANKISFYDFHATLEQKQFNTIDRKNNDKNFQKKFNGTVLPDNGIESQDLIEQCDFNATKLMKDSQ